LQNRCPSEEGMMMKMGMIMMIIDDVGANEAG